MPANAQALALTVTSDRALAPGFLTVHGCGSSLPELSNVNVRPEGPTANLAVVAVDATRQTCIFSDRGTDLIVDLVGWFGPGGSPFQEFAPRRRGRHAEPVAAPARRHRCTLGRPVRRDPRDMLGVPAEADAVVVNLTVTQATGYGYLTAFPCGDDPPNTSNVNYNVGVDRANASIMALGPQGSLCVRLSESSAHVVVDVNGWFGGTTGIHYGARTQRIADSRNGLGGWSGTFAPGETRILNPEAQLPAGSRVAVLGVVSTVSSTAGFITVQPCGGQAEVSNLNFVGGVDIANLAVVPLADDGTICVTSSARTHIVVDVFGGFGSGGLARELSIGGATMFPEFSPAQHDYIAYCQSDDGQPAVGPRARHAAHTGHRGLDGRLDGGRHHGVDRRRRRHRRAHHPDRWWGRPTSTGSAAFPRTSRRSRRHAATTQRRPAGTCWATATSRPTARSG